jgi:hypothetical protein
MLISSFYGDAFDGQFALRLKDTARAFGIDCEFFRWSRERGDGDKNGLRCKLLTRHLVTRPGEDVLFLDPDAQLHRRPDILLDEKDFDVAVYYDTGTMQVSGDDTKAVKR